MRTKITSLVLLIVLLAPQVGHAQSMLVASSLRERAALRRAKRIEQRRVPSRMRRRRKRSSVQRIRTTQRSTTANRTSLQRSHMQLEREVLYLTNAERAKYNLPPFRRNNLLDIAARKHAEDMHRRRYFSHISLEGETAANRIEKTSYGTIDRTTCNCRGWRIELGENIATGQKSAAEAISGWLNSPPHREALLSSKYTEIGIGVVGNKWVQTFGDIEIYTIR